SVERCLKSLCNEGTSVLVHCSDGWDRTTQIVSLFFLQFLDCVYQLWEKNTDQFEFNRRYLMKLAQHTFSGLFGTFLFNSLKDAIKNGCDPNDTDEHRHRCFQVWSYLGKHNTEFRNPAFREDYAGGMLRYPKTLPELLIWRDAYYCTADQSLINNPNEPSHQNTGTGSTQDVSSDKVNNGLSRSQSAASLTSLVEQSMNLTTPIPSPGPTIGFGVSCGSPCIGHSATKIHDNCTIGSISAVFCQKCLDVDGLSRVPSQFEDKVLR
uniref:Myotubularin phosphatase domain-containing protein n=1 Tax=Meloidogyne javanica TaxID=6303 RepID=A0A915MLI1_MELJA